MKMKMKIKLKMKYQTWLVDAAHFVRVTQPQPQPTPPRHGPKSKKSFPPTTRCKRALLLPDQLDNYKKRVTSPSPFHDIKETDFAMGSPAVHLSPDDDAEGCDLHAKMDCDKCKRDSSCSFASPAAQLPTKEALVGRFIEHLVLHEIQRAHARKIMAVFMTKPYWATDKEQSENLSLYYHELLTSGVATGYLKVDQTNKESAILDRILLLLPSWKERCNIEAAKNTRHRNGYSRAHTSLGYVQEDPLPVPSKLPSQEVQPDPIQNLASITTNSLSTRAQVPSSTLTTGNIKNSEFFRVSVSVFNDKQMSLANVETPELSQRAPSSLTANQDDQYIPLSLFTFYQKHLEWEQRSSAMQAQRARSYNDFLSEGRTPYESVHENSFPKDSAEPEMCYDAAESRLEGMVSESSKSATGKANLKQGPKPLDSISGPNCVAQQALGIYQQHAISTTKANSAPACQQRVKLHVGRFGTFTRFKDLPRELRDRVYTFIVCFDEPIEPHLCDQGGYGGGPRFHDDKIHHTEASHNEIYQRLAITRTNKATRGESLPIFYRENTFLYNQDSRIYFERLTKLGRFDMIRHVSFTIGLHRGDGFPQRILKDIYDALQLETDRSSPSRSILDASEYAGMFLLLRKLSKMFTEDARTVTLKVPSAQWFVDLPGLAWFKEVAEGAGLNVKLISSEQLSGHEHWCVHASWIHRFQQEDKRGAARARETAQDILKTGFVKYPSLMSLRKRPTWFYRRNCRGGITWCQQV